MARILEFRSRWERKSSHLTDRGELDENFSAEIIIFPGIRIERYDFDDHEAFDDHDDCVDADNDKSSSNA